MALPKHENGSARCECPSQRRVRGSCLFRQIRFHGTTLQRFSSGRNGLVKDARSIRLGAPQPHSLLQLGQGPPRQSSPWLPPPA